MSPVRTTCAYCGVGCGVLATPGEGRSVTIAGDPDHPANAGRLCSKGTHLGETVGLEGRLLHPMIGQRQANWNKALDLVARKFARTISKYGPDSVAFYVSGQLLTEDYYVANKLMKGFIGSGNIDTNSRLCMSSAVAGHIRALGEDVVPATYDDLDAADLIILIGSNTAWCHPIVYQRIQAAREKRGTKLVVVDPRRTETCENADLHIALKPGTDIALMNGLLAHCRRSGVLDETYLKRSVEVPSNFWSSLDNADLWTTAKTCDVPASDLATLFDWFAATPRTVTLFSQGINQSVRGTDQVNAITNLHLATGRVGKPGAAPFSITGQPNAMGGREVGGLASTLAAHMDFAPENVERVGRFWSAERMATKPGLKAVDLFRAIRRGEIKALWVMATNPAVSLPDVARVRDALGRCEFLVVSDVVSETDTSHYAHVRLPAAAWGEKDGTVTNSERLISRQRAFFPLPGEAKPDWWIVSQVAQRMGWHDAFNYHHPADIWREHARLSTYENDGRRLFALPGHSGALTRTYDSMTPFRWGGQPFADGTFPTSTGKARLVTVRQPPLEHKSAFPLTLNTGRYRDQWHSMTRTGLSPKLARHRDEPRVEVHPRDGTAARLVDGGLAKVTTAVGESLFRVSLVESQRRGELFVPIHWTDQQSTGGRAGKLTRPLTDPISGQPGFKSTPAAVSPQPVDWRGFLILHGETSVRPDCLWATRVKVQGGTLFEVAGLGSADALRACLPKGELIELSDPARGTQRTAVMKDGRLAAVMFLTRDGELPTRDWLIERLDQPHGYEILAGLPAGPVRARGTLVCVCFDVGATTIMDAIADQRLTTVAEVGTALRAGTNCGSCRPAIAKLLQQVKEPANAA
ncbi:molybdopterin-dependent oxidoreductase [Sphingomonas piscis]|uniref:Molybdopterin-dependent oxidoreductase n=1 Tax=Sphingomonas piscis TaxID=2714943 RepID=A0A6G7YRZ6_9SPHN|nr:nitrate reductase [Sphingomonas piscis]QIK79515.1 molybdopterin-dependent oxidoreductase [Sphingomonas piscis]